MRHVKRARNIGKKGVLFIVQKEGKVCYFKVEVSKITYQSRLQKELSMGHFGE